jgi:hypothetical protein
VGSKGGGTKVVGKAVVASTVVVSSVADGAVTGVLNFPAAAGYPTGAVDVVPAIIVSAGR